MRFYVGSASVSAFDSLFRKNFRLETERGVFLELLFLFWVGDEGEAMGVSVLRLVKVLKLVYNISLELLFRHYVRNGTIDHFIGAFFYFELVTIVLIRLTALLNFTKVLVTLKKHFSLVIIGYTWIEDDEKHRVQIFRRDKLLRIRLNQLVLIH